VAERPLGLVGQPGADPVCQRERAQACLTSAGLRGECREGRADRVRGLRQGAGDSEPSIQDSCPGGRRSKDRISHPGRRLCCRLRSGKSG
jgi:hypothetical protein